MTYLLEGFPVLSISGVNDFRFVFVIKALYCLNFVNNTIAQMNVFQRFWYWLLSLFLSKELTLTIVGLPNAGKSTFVRAISGEDTEEPISPTIGLRRSSHKIHNVEFNIYDMGGDQEYQWSFYCRSSNFVIYMVDSSDQEAVERSESQLDSLIKDEELKGVPILVVANKEDLPGAYKKNEIEARLRLKEDESDRISLFCASAKKRTNVEPIICWIIDHM